MSDDFQQRPTDPLEEPSVLDFLKSITRDRASFVNFVRSLWDARRRAGLDRALAEEVRRQLAPPEQGLQVGGASPVEPPRLLPWRSLLALFLALYAQVALEPPGRNYGLALPLYFLSAGLVIWSYSLREWRLPALPASNGGADPLTTRLLPLFASVLLALLAFWDFGEGIFTPTNLALWTCSLALLAAGLWLPAIRRAGSVMNRRKAAAWALLLIVALGVTGFFRFHRLQAVPAEPFSDHAEKILDVFDITQGHTAIFFPRNTGREAFQMYWTWLVARLAGTGLSFFSLKLGTALLGLLTLPFIYLLGRELGNARAGLFALALFGIGYWPNLMARMGLRFPLYPLFVAPVLFYLVRGLRTRSRNDFILAGIFLGLGLHGYSPFRIVPILVLAAFAAYLSHRHSRGARQDALLWLTITAVVSLYFFLPLLRYSLQHPAVFSYRAFSRLGGVEAPLPGPALPVFFVNLWNALLMFNWDNGEIWVHSVPHRPALDIVSGALFLIGLLLLLVRYGRGRDWRDLLLLVSIPILLMPSILSLAFPGENPALNRAAGAAVPAMVVSALALDGLAAAFGGGRLRRLLGAGIPLGLLALSALQNYDLVFRQFDQNFRSGAWNSSEMGGVINEFSRDHGRTDTVWIVPFPHWVDTRLPGIWAGIPNRDFALWPANFSDTLSEPSPKLFIFWPEDVDSERALAQLYPRGVLSRFASATPGKDFMVFFVQ